MKYQNKKASLRILFTTILIIALFIGFPKVLAAAYDPPPSGFGIQVFHHNLNSDIHVRNNSQMSESMSEKIKLNMTIRNSGNRDLVGEELKMLHQFVDNAGRALSKAGTTSFPFGRVVPASTVSFDLFINYPYKYADDAKLELTLKYKGRVLHTVTDQIECTLIPPPPPPPPGSGGGGNQNNENTPNRKNAKHKKAQAYYNNIHWRRPYTGNQPVTSPFGPRNSRFHNGTDYGLSCGTNLYAAAAGKVIKVSRKGIILGNASTTNTPSNYVIIKHTKGWKSFYWHMHKVKVNEGQKVDLGTFIGTSGNTGYVRGSSSSPLKYQGCHLHFELRKNDVPFDPESIYDNPLKPKPIYTVGYKGAKPNKKYAGLKGKNMERPHVVINRFINTWATKKWNELKEYHNLDNAIITYAQTAPNKKSVTIYGVAVPQNHLMQTTVFNEYRNNPWWSSWQVINKQRKIKRSKVVLFKSGWEYLGHIWNDHPDGKWSIKLPLSKNLSPGDKLFAELQVQSNFSVNQLKWWFNTYEHNVKFNLRPLFQRETGYPYWASGQSNKIRVPKR